jgi:hypothetical protein
MAAMNEIGGLVSDELIQRLNTPYPPSSVGGEDPHRRTGQLSAGVRFSVDEIGSEIITNVVSERYGGDPNVPLFLNSGTSKMAPRPYMTKTEEEWQQKFPITFEELFWSFYQ